MTLGATGSYVGAQNCSTSGCHGGAGDKSKQYTIWFRADAHSRAHSTLTTARSQRMAESLKIENAALSRRCTECHAPLASLAPAHEAGGVRPEEGVSCESCHGAAAGWVRSHTRTDYTRAQRISSGMRDLEDLYLRANTCVACHQVIPADIVAAGHPRLSFELAGHSDREPRHWKEIWGGPQLWVVGQLSSLRELSGSLTRQTPPDPEVKASWDSSLWMCQLILGSLSSKQSLTAPAPGTLPDKTFVQRCDGLAKEHASIKWDTTWNRSLLIGLSRHLARMSSSDANEELFRLRLEKISSGMRVLASTMDPDLRKNLDPLLEKLNQSQSLPVNLTKQQLPSLSEAFLQVLSEAS